MEKKYYWIKLKRDFFDQAAIDFLMAQQNGCEYVVLYQMLCLKTANNGGEFVTSIGEVLVPYDVPKIVRDTKYFDFDTVTIALELYKKLGLVYEEDNKVLRIANMAAMVGSESAGKEAIRKREYRERLLLEARDNERDKSGTICPTENRDKSLEDKRESKEKEFLADFEEAWKAYPNKKGKDNAQRDYLKARKEGVSKEEILSGIERYKWQIAACRTEPQYILHGSTWFHQRRWTDEFTERRDYTERRYDDSVYEGVYE